jgi:hypothetical protein
MLSLSFIIHHRYINRYWQQRPISSLYISIKNNDTSRATHERTYYRQERPFLLFDATTKAPIALFTGTLRPFAVTS